MVKMNSNLLDDKRRCEMLGGKLQKICDEFVEFETKFLSSEAVLKYEPLDAAIMTRIKTQLINIQKHTTSMLDAIATTHDKHRTRDHINVIKELIMENPIFPKEFADIVDSIIYYKKHARDNKYYDPLIWECHLKKCNIYIVDHSNSDYRCGYGLKIEFNNLIKYIEIDGYMMQFYNHNDTEKVNIIGILTFVKKGLNITTQISYRTLFTFLIVMLMASNEAAVTNEFIDIFFEDVNKPLLDDIMN